MLSYELLLEQIRDMRKNMDTEVLVYGRQELMLCQNCIVKDSHKDCNRCAAPQFIKDRRGEQFLLRKEFGCRNTVLNSHTLYLLDRLYDFEKLGVSHLRLNFTDEDRTTCAKMFDNALNCAAYKPKNFTRGLYYKGVK